MISTDKQRADFYYRKEQETRLLITQRTQDLYERAERTIELRVKRYPKGMRKHLNLYVEQMHRDLCDEDLERKKMIDNQQHFLRLAQAYETRHLRGLLAQQAIA